FSVPKIRIVHRFIPTQLGSPRRNEFQVLVLKILRPLSSAYLFQARISRFLSFFSLRHMLECGPLRQWAGIVPTLCILSHFRLCYRLCRVVRFPDSVCWFNSRRSSAFWICSVRMKLSFNCDTTCHHGKPEKASTLGHVI